MNVKLHYLADLEPEGLYEHLKERDLDCDYSRSREMVYLDGKEVDDYCFIEIAGCWLNVTAKQFDKITKEKSGVILPVPSYTMNDGMSAEQFNEIESRK